MIGYYFMGFAIANYANGGLVGNGPFFCLGINTDGLLKFVFQFSYAVTATTIVTGSLAERFHIDTYITFAFIMCAVIYPVPASWIWGGGWLSEYGFADYAGSGIVCMTGGFAGFSGSVLLGPRIGRFDEDLDYKNTKKKMQMLSKERQNKKTKQNKKQKDKVGKKKVTPNEKAEDKRKTEKAQGHKKKNKGKKIVDKVKKNGYESFGSDENVDDQYKQTKAMTRQRQAFYFSSALPVKDRVGIFRNDFPEFNQLDDEQTKQLIMTYDHNMLLGHQQSDPGITLIGGLLIWAGWLFMTCAAGYDIVEFTHRQVPQQIALNTMVSGAAAGAAYAGVDFFDITVHNRMRVQDPQGILNAVMAGVVSISAACNNVGVTSSVIIGFIGSMSYIGSCKLLHRYKIDDPTNSFQIFGASGLWGCLAVGIFDGDRGLINTGSF